MYNMTEIDNAWWHFEASNQYQKLIKQYTNNKISIDEIILGFLKTIPGEFGQELQYAHNNNIDSTEYCNAIECITEDLIDKELL